MYREKYVDLLSIVRGLAALFVLASHTRAIILSDFATLNTSNLVHILIYSLTALGHQAVIVFFVLSGYFISLSVYKTGKENNFSLVRYFINRISRLWVVVIPGVFLTLVWDRLTGYIEMSGGDYYSISQLNLDLPESLESSIFDLLGNLFFLQSILSPTIGTNSSLWSLANEFWYYLFFGISCYFWYEKKKITSFLVVFLLFVFPVNIYSYAPIWGIGVAALWITLFVNKKSIFISPILGATIFALTLVFSLKYTSLYVDYLLAFSTLILIVSGRKVKFCSGFVMFVGCGLSKISFSLYVIHLPFTIFLVLLFSVPIKTDLSLVSASYLLGLLSINILYAVLFYRLFESKTSKVRSWLEKKIGYSGL